MTLTATKGVLNKFFTNLTHTTHQLISKFLKSYVRCLAGGRPKITVRLRNTGLNVT